MVFLLTGILDARELAELRASLAGGTWVDGRETASGVAARVKSNLQLAEGDPLRVELGARVVAALVRSPDFNAAALPRKVYPPGFNRYPEGGAYGAHVDGVVRSFPGTTGVVRCDLSGTLFLSEPDEYDGGELVVREPSAAHEVKPPAGSVFLYPSTTLHEVRPVTRGTRLTSFFWVQSLVRDHEERRMLFDLEGLAQQVVSEMPGASAGLELLALRNTLLQRWSET